MMRNRVLMYSLLIATTTGASACTRTIQSTETSIPGATAPSVRGDAPDAVGAATGKSAVEGFLKAVKAHERALGHVERSRA
jgi:hypothetical protein